MVHKINLIQRKVVCLWVVIFSLFGIKSSVVCLELLPCGNLDNVANLVTKPAGEAVLPAVLQLGTRSCSR